VKANQAEYHLNDAICYAVKNHERGIKFEDCLKEILIVAHEEDSASQSSWKDTRALVEANQLLNIRITILRVDMVPSRHSFSQLKDLVHGLPNYSFQCSDHENTLNPNHWLHQFSKMATQRLRSNEAKKYSTRLNREEAKKWRGRATI